MDDAILAALFGALFNIMDKLGDLILTTGVLDPAGHYAQPVGKTGAGVCPVQHPTDLCLRDQRSAEGEAPLTREDNGTAGCVARRSAA